MNSPIWAIEPRADEKLCTAARWGSPRFPSTSAERYAAMKPDVCTVAAIA